MSSLEYLSTRNAGVRPGTCPNLNKLKHSNSMSGVNEGINTTLVGIVLNSIQ